MKLTEERLVKMILEELDAMGEVFRAKGESDEEYAERKAAAQKGTKGLGRMGASREVNQMQLQARPLIMALKVNPRARFIIGQDVYNYIKDLGTVDMTRLSVRED